MVGSSSILGAKPLVAGSLTVSADIDLFPRFNESGGKNELIDKHFGSGTQFEVENSFYIEGVGSWTMMTSPAGWEKRLIPIVSPGGVKGWCLDPFDLAYNKLEAGREKDLQYVGEMVRTDITPESSLAAFLRQYAPNKDVLQTLEENLRRAKVEFIAKEVSQELSNRSAPSLASGIQTPRGPLPRNPNPVSENQKHLKQVPRRGMGM